MSKDKVFEAMRKAIPTINGLKIENADQVIRALRVFNVGKSDFADCLIERSANSAGCEKTITFDVNASKHSGMTLVA